MTKYEEALEQVMKSCNAYGKQQYSILKEAVNKANDYDELNNKYERMAKIAKALFKLLEG